MDIIELTKQHENVKQKIEDTKAFDGRDIAEDIVGAFERGLEFKFLAPTCLIYHICDAPCHGERYHDEDIADNHLVKGERYLEEKVKRFKEIPNAKNVYFHAIKINDYTDIMFGIMKEEFGLGFEISEIKKPEDLVNVMISTMSKSISNSHENMG